MEIKLDIDEITPEYIKSLGVSFQAFKEIYEAIIPLVKIKNYKLVLDFPKDQEFEDFYNLPISEEITAALINSTDFSITNHQREELRKIISVYVYISTLIKLKKRILNPLLSLLYGRNGQLRLIGPVYAFIRKMAKQDGETIDRETSEYITAWDFFIKSNLIELDLISNKRNGRPPNKLEDYFLGQIKKLIISNSKRYMNDLVSIIRFLKQSYDPIFSELPMSEEAIKKSLQSFNSESNDTSSQN